MAHFETWYVCPVCKRTHDEYEDVVKCRNNHPIQAELWAVGKYKAVKVFGNHADNSVHGRAGALIAADKNDFVEDK